MASLARVTACLDKWRPCGYYNTLRTSSGNSYTSPSFHSDSQPDVRWKLIVRNGSHRSCRCQLGHSPACSACAECVEFSLALEGGGKAEELEPELSVVVCGFAEKFCDSVKSICFPVQLKINTPNKQLDDPVINASITFNYPREPSELPGLVQGGFPRLLADADFADFEVRVGEERVPIHRALFAAFSPVFKRMFLGDAEEKAQGFVVVEDVSAEAVRGLQAFLYSGRVAEVRDDLATYLHLAEKYGIQELKGFCDSELRKTLSTANLCERAVLADRYGLEGLFEECQDLLKGEEWGRLTVPKGDWRKLVEEHRDVSDRLAHFVFPDEEDSEAQ